ncbi:Spc98 family-domain-containing protein [Dipodascopsis uninucleata]
MNFWAPDMNDDEHLSTIVSKISLKTKADVLAASKAPTDPSEISLLQDLPYTLQGLNSTRLPFSDSTTVSLPGTLPLPTISILHTLVEPAILHKSLRAFIESPSGLIGQAFRRAIETELRGFLALVIRIDEEIRKEVEAEKEQPEFKQGWSVGGVTLRKCIFWLREPTMILRLISDMVERSKDKNGGQILNVLHSYTTHGDPFVSSFANRLMKSVSRPFYEFVQQWIYTGDVRDPYKEFFVRKREEKNVMWDERYILDESQVPAFMSPVIVERIFQTGKSLDFIRSACGEGEWVDKYGTEHFCIFVYGESRGMDQAVSVAYNKTVTYLMEILTNKFKLRDHIQALKNYLLLGQGDFVAMLMELLAPSLERPANTLYRHNLTATLETAIRGSNAQYSIPEALKNLDARMLELSHGEIGWDVFTLEYKVEAPLDVIVNPYATRQYLKIFNFLWRLKRVGYVLNVAWRRSITGERGVLSGVKDIVEPDWKTARACCSEMIHFICQLEYYILYEVIESSWSELQNEMSKPDLTLDKLIEVHSRYLGSITHKGLLGSGRHGNEDSLIHQLHEILKIMLSFANTMDSLYDLSLEEYTRRQTTNTLMEDTVAINPELHKSISSRIKDHKNIFRQLVERLLSELAYQSDTEMRFLGVRLNFNEYYTINKRKRDRGSRTHTTTAISDTAGHTSMNSSKEANSSNEKNEKK